MYFDYCRTYNIQLYIVLRHDIWDSLVAKETCLQVYRKWQYPGPINALSLDDPYMSYNWVVIGQGNDLSFVPRRRRANVGINSLRPSDAYMRR